MSKKVVLITIAVGVLLAASTAFAAATMPMTLQVGPNGRALLRGTIDSVGSTTLTVKSWGGDWTVNISSGTRLLPQATSTSNFSKGDTVGVIGNVNTGANWTIDALLVRDWTYLRAVHTNQENRVGTTSTSTHGRY